MKWRVFEDQWGKEDFPKDGKGRFYFIIIIINGLFSNNIGSVPLFH